MTSTAVTGVFKRRIVEGKTFLGPEEQKVYALSDVNYAHLATLRDEFEEQGLACDGEELVAVGEIELSPATKALLTENSYTIGRDSRPSETYEEWRSSAIHFLTVEIGESDGKNLNQGG